MIACCMRDRDSFSRLICSPESRALLRMDKLPFVILVQKTRHRTKLRENHQEGSNQWNFRKLKENTARYEQGNTYFYTIQISHIILTNLYFSNLHFPLLCGIEQVLRVPKLCLSKCLSIPLM